MAKKSPLLVTLNISPANFSRGARGIHVAAQKGHVSVIHAMIAKGEDVNAQTNHNYTALHMAIEAGKARWAEINKKNSI